jgi:predicted peptidase
MFGALCSLILRGLMAAPDERAAPGQHAYSFSRETTKTVSGSYLLYLPKDYDKEHKTWPLIVYLHGGSVRGNNVEALKTLGLPSLLERDPSFPFIVLSPQCPQGEIWTDADAFIALLDEVISKFPVDRERIYLTGHSMGGRGTWYFGYKYPERFAAIAPMAGPATISAWASRLKEMPIWVFHGAKDIDVPLRESEDMVKALAAVGNEALFTIYPDRDHYILDTYENKELYNWFLQHRRPKVVSGK